MEMRMMILRPVLAGFVAGALGLGSVPSSFAQTYPAEPVKFVIAFAPGGPADIIGRLVGQKLQEKWGQTVVIENRGGAGGNIAARQVAKAEANGATVLVSTSALAVNVTLSANPGYAPDDFKVAAVVATTPNLIVAAPTLKQTTLKEIIEASKTEKFSYGSAGTGTTPHLSAEKIFRVLGGAEIPHVAHTGAAPALNATLGGHVTFATLAMPTAIEQVRAGQVKAIAVTSAKRVAALPGVPTAIEQGYGDSEDSTWVALYVPAATPQAAIDKINADVASLLADAEFQKQLEKIGFLPVGGIPAAAQTYFASEVKKWGDIVRRLGLKAE
jgi:tripartite-type tricarboxylate transporter receptor subunit TctC